MKLVIQRVESASVAVEGKKVSGIKKGLFVLVGISPGDNRKNAEALAGKLTKLRIMADSKGKMNLSVTEVSGEILVVSQFTLYADTSGGRRPSFIHAAKPDQAEKIYRYFLTCLKNEGNRVQTGIFGEYMKIALTADGPVTILLDN
jgi:D-tyrosyl-tRNA(Tyr) deacylase